MKARVEQGGRDWRPAYIRAAEDLRDRILGGEFPAGSTIQSEPVLADRYGISRKSIRKALQQLRDWGLVETQQGSGTYVLPQAEPGAPMSAGTPRTSPSIGDYLSGLDSQDSMSPSRQIANQVRSAIRSGRLPPGTKLPSQKQLTERYGVARETVKAALRQLAAEGLIVSRQGSGSFICPRDRAENGSHPITVDQGAARAFKAAMDSLDQVHGQAVSAIWTMRERQQASECSAELIAKLRELAEVAANLQNEAVTRIVEREETPHAKGDDF